MESDPEVEKIAVDVVMQYEADQARKPVSVEAENCGWDVTSLHEGQVARYIEVKGRAGEGGVALTPNEWIKAQRFGTDYWLYVVVNCKGSPQWLVAKLSAKSCQTATEKSNSCRVFSTNGRGWQKRHNRVHCFDRTKVEDGLERTYCH